jgi:hypothetical protein
MWAKGSWLMAFVLVGLFAGPASSAEEESNAALRYWMAFAMMENPPAAGDVAKRIEEVSEGVRPWDETLATIVDRNEAALSTMNRGTRLSFCNWGLEPQMMADAPVAHVSRARALARLNILRGMRLLQQGKAAEAVETWLAGIRFSGDLSNGPLVATSVAAGALRAHLSALRRAVMDGKVDEGTRRRVEQAVAALPESGFDWGVGVGFEVGMFPMLADSLEREPDPATIARTLGIDERQLAGREAMPGMLRRSAATGKELGPKFVAAIRGPYEGSASHFREIDARAAADPILSKVWASAARCNELRGEVVRARADLLAALRR